MFQLFNERNSVIKKALRYEELLCAGRMER